MLRPSIAAVIPVYNRATSVWPTLDSVAHQTVPPERLVVVDDGSSDGSAESIERWIAARRPAFDVQVIRKPNGGVSSARNRAIAECTGSLWFGFLDSDDIWPPDFLARAAAALAAEPAAIAASADRLFVDQHAGTQRLYALQEMADDPIRWMFRHGAAISSCTVVRADLVRERGGFLEHLPTGEDAALYLPLCLRGKWLHLPGDPVSFCRRFQTDGEETSLSRKFTDNHRRWARIFESFYTGLTADERRHIIEDRKIRRLISDRWNYAGQELERQGRLLESTACYARAIRWRPRKWARWQALLGAPMRIANSRRRAA
jgi:glycosyltransferase involved in cell wall biosynthesis